MLTDCYSAVVDIVFILDSSRSVHHRDFTRMLHFTSNLVLNLNIDGGDARVGIITYSHTTNVEFYLSQYQIEKELFTAIGKIPHYEGLSTNTGEALKRTREEMFTAVHGDRPEVPNVAILITDGNSQQPDITKIEAEISKEAGIHIFAIGIGNVLLYEINAIASEPLEENVFYFRDFEKLQYSKDLICATLSKRKLLKSEFIEFVLIEYIYILQLRYYVYVIIINYIIAQIIEQP